MHPWIVDMNIRVRWLDRGSEGEMRDGQCANKTSEPTKDGKGIHGCSKRKIQRLVWLCDAEVDTHRKNV